MELLFVTLGGTLLGAVLRYVLPQRQSYGALLLPAVGTIVAATVWAALTWAGWRFDATWIWVVSLAAAGSASFATAVLLPRRRRESDARLLSTLTRA